MKVSNNYVCVTKLEEEKKEGFVTADVQDNFVYKGKVAFLPEAPVYIGNEGISLDSIILFAKYSPDTHEIEIDGVKYKFVKVTDILAVL